MKEPLAKGKPEYTSLKSHSISALKCEEAVISALEPYLCRLGPDFAEQMRRMALYHDLGKAAVGMQRTLAGGPRWGFRHEVLSVAILQAAGYVIRYPLALAAILTHHKALNDPALTGDAGANSSEDDDEYFLAIWKTRAAELGEYWGWILGCLKYTDPAATDIVERLPQHPKDLQDVRSFYRWLTELFQEPQYSGLKEASLPYIISRGMLMAADHLSSSGINSPLVKLSHKPLKLRRFQQRVADITGSAILEAPTGSGKTRAAIAWALKNRVKGERIFYVLPYQASINAMARTLTNRSGFGFTEESVGIIHHNALLQEFRQYFDQDDDNYTYAITKAGQRIDQTKQFYRPIKIITPYQILKLLFGSKHYELGLAEMLGGILIFDEIHAYEPHVMALIEEGLSRLKALDIRVLFMSATFPRFLKDRLFCVFGDIPSVTLDEGDEWEHNLLHTARHRLRLHDCFLEEMVPDILAAARSGTVLVVCNRVEQAKRMFDLLNGEAASINLIHGGFTARDRYIKENHLFAKPGSMKPASNILVSTQVVEVSLNISFDTIFTEIAPVDDLLQRFGRVNRIYDERLGTVEVHVAKLFDSDSLKYIYDIERLALTLAHAPDGTNLMPSIERDWVQAVYSGGYLKKEQDKYNLARESFRRVIDELRPMHNGHDEDFYELFSSISVLPAGLVGQYQKAIEQERFLEASQLMISLPMGTFKKLERDSGIQSVPLGNNKQRNVFVVKRQYDADIGLLDEPESLPAAII
jgi:CRISPR-associated endonuclease/helicase Cas3